MTDNNNLDDIEEDFADFDNDEFDDTAEGDFAEGDEFVEEEWDSFDQDGDMMTEDPAGKKKSSLVLNLVIGLVALGGAGFVGMKFMGGGAPPQGQSRQQQVAGNDMNAASLSGVGNGQVATDAATSAPARANVAGGNGVADFTPPPSDPELDFDMPMPFSNEGAVESVGQSASSMDAQQDQETSTAMSVDDAVSAPAPAGFDSEPLTPLPMGDSANDGGAEAAQNALTGFDTTGDMVDETRSMSSGSDGEVISAVEGKIDQLFDRLDGIEARLSESGSSYDDSALKSSIAKLEKRMDALSRKISSGAVRSTSSSTSARDVTTRSSSQSEPDIRWTLTSAQPGRATLKKSGQGDVISISIGDYVAGLGKVTSIRLTDGKWVVSATNGKIVQ